MPVGRIYLASDAVIMVNAFVNCLSGIYREVEIVVDATHTFDMVSMVMSNEQVVDAAQRESVVSEEFLQGAYSNTGINHDTIILSI